MSRNYDPDEFGHTEEEYPEWADKVRRLCDRFRQENFLRDMDERIMERRLRMETLIGFSYLQAAAAAEGHPDFMLRVFKETARITGLTSSDLSISFNPGVEALPDLSDLSDEELARLTGATAMIEEKHGEPEQRHQAKKPVVAKRSRKRSGASDQ